MTRFLPLCAALAAFSLAPLGAATPAFADAANLKIVHFNDLDRMDGYGDSGGVARLATIVQQIRAENPNVLVTNGGDSISPSLLSGFDKGAHMIDLFNKVGIDAMVLGNHEFDFGPDVAETRISEANFPILSNNAIEGDGTLLDGVTDFMLFQAGDYTVGMFGLTTVGTAVKSSPGDVTFSDPVEVAEAMSAQLREAGADLVIALAHTDIEEDYDLIAASPVDIVLSGDDHDLRVNYDGNMLLTESGSQAQYVTVIDIDMDMVEGRRGPKFVWTPSVELINTTATEPDAALAAAVKSYEDRLSSELDIEIGTTSVALDSRRTTVRSQENALSNLIVDAMLGASGGDLALTNGGGIRADKIYEPGTMLTRRDIQSELPFGNKTVVIEVSGADVIAALENGVSKVEDGAGRFPHIAGGSFAFDASKPAGERVSKVMVGGAPIDPAKIYKLATNDFVGKGGDGYGMFAEAPRLIDKNAGELMAVQVIRYIEAAGSVAPKVEGRVTRLD